jgi:hypothetical protein
MRNLQWKAAAFAAIGISLFLTACGGSGSPPPPPPTTYVVTVDSANPATGVSIGVTPQDNNGATSGTTSFARTYDSGASVTLTAPNTAGSNPFSSWTGCTSASTVTCTVTLNANTTVTANYAVIVTPTVTATLSSSSITTAQALTVTVAVNGGSGNPTPTGTVTLTSGSYTSAAVTLSGGGATFTVAAGTLPVGTDTLTVTYTPDATSSSIYTGASGTASVTVAKSTPTVTVTPSPASITPAQALSVTVAVSGGSGNPTPTGAVTLSSGSYTSATATLIGGTATISVAAGSLATGTDTLTVTYTPDAASSPTYNSTSGTSPVTVTPVYVLTVNSINPASGVQIQVDYPPPIDPFVGTTSFTQTAAAGTQLVLTAPANSSGNAFLSWTGCTSSSTVTCKVTLNGNMTVTANYAAPATYSLTIDSASPASGVEIQASPSDVNGNGSGTTPLTRTYKSGTSVTLTAVSPSDGYSFVVWNGCASSSTVTCDVTMNANTTVTAMYSEPNISSITVTPNTATIGDTVQMVATVNGTGNFSSAVSWALTCPSCGSLSPGTLSSSGLYTTPYPAPATVTVKATSTETGFTNISGSTTVTLNSPATATGPALTVNVASPGNPISPEIYGMDAYLLDATSADTAAVAKANITIDRWGGDSTERYNYQVDVTSSIADWYFENSTGNGGDGWPAVSGTKAFDYLVETNNSDGIKTLGTVPVLGYVAKDSTSCSFLKSTYPGQVSYNGNCGVGEYPDGTAGCTDSGGCDIYGNSTIAALTSISEPPPTPPAASAVTTAWADATWTGGWVNYLVNKFGPGNPASGASTGVAIYDLDNEPTWWDAEDRDVHPLPFTYDEVTNGGIGTALAIKTVDPTAQVSGPVIDYWWAYFYSKKDIESGWSSGSCYEPWSNPVDRKAHGGVPLIEYYLQQFAAAQATYGIRLLDYVDLHTYFAPNYPFVNGAGLGLAPAGDTGAQQARLNATRAFWDPTYTDPSDNYPQPNYITDPNHTTSCSPPQQAPQLIPMMKTWVTKDYPGTKTAIDEYNFGGMEAINGALTEADILGIFGRQGLDLGTMWPTTDPSEQIPGMMAFAIYRNYDGNKSTFGDTVLPSASTNSSNADAEGQLAVYGAIHTAGAATGTVTVVVINKTYGALTSTLSLTGLSASATTAQAYLYSNANLNAIAAQPAVTVTPPAGGSSTGTIANYTFPAQSITLFVIPQ